MKKQTNMAVKKTTDEQVKAYLLKHHKTGTFTINDVKQNIGKKGDAHHVFANPFARLCTAGVIERIGTTLRRDGGGTGLKLYRLCENNIAQAEIKTAKTKREFQIEAATRAQRTHEAALRLSRALGIPVGMAA